MTTKANNDTPSWRRPGRWVSVHVGGSVGCGRRGRPSLDGGGRVAFMASFADGKIQAYVGPPELGAADDLERVIVEFIAGA